MEVYIDAAFHPKNKDGSIVSIIKDGSKSVMLGRYLTQVEDNHLAEFKALELVLLWLVDNNKQHEVIIIHSDSQIVAESINKKYVKEPMYARVLSRIIPLLNQFDLLFVKWIPEKNNRQADQLAKQILRKQKDWPFS